MIGTEPKRACIILREEPYLELIATGMSSCGFRHSERQGQIITLLIQFAPQGQTLPECPISTAEAIDVGWLDASRNEIGQDIPLLTRAPEICIEILSPSNSAAEIAEKRALYFNAGGRRGLDMQPRRLNRILLRS